MAAPQSSIFPTASRARGLGLPALDRQHKPAGSQPAVRRPVAMRCALLGVLQLGILRRHVVGKVAFLEDPFRRILIGGRHVIGFNARDCRRSRRAIPGGLGGWRRCPCPPGDQFGVAPRSACRRAASRARRSSAAGSRPDTICPGRNAGSRPARSGRAAADQLVGGARFCRADGGGVPLLAFEIIDRDEGRLAAHGQPHVAGLERSVDMLAERVERSPASSRTAW
jgi:hypothetical protein